MNSVKITRVEISPRKRPCGCHNIHAWDSMGERYTREISCDESDAKMIVKRISRAGKINPSQWKSEQTEKRGA